ncbi:MAG TPA: malto-oligosyltrehalose synthase [Nocardioidaceae bacterium]|nr:malto-oligosyltrehalose synthase [Nocardioidaceae bacterium]
MIATYRLQLHAGFTFADAESRVPYLASLGVSHLYLSPVLQAVSGSQHGYDVLDHTRVNEELGGEQGLVSLAEVARSHGLGVVVDVVPNHMALVAPEHSNAPLWETLRHGREAATAHWFDVDWEAGDGRLGLPVLGGTLEEALTEGEVRLDEHDGEQVVRYYDHVFPVSPGTGGDDVAEVLSRQHYLLANWRDSDAVLNYRRFFDVGELIAVRVELPDVFEATHRLLLDLNHRGVVEGFRIDHPDGLADPEGYLRQLREATLPGTGIWVEKILEGEERLPRSWPCDGTTGYDAMRAVTAALVDPVAAPALDECWHESGGGLDLPDAVERAKRKVVDELLGPEVSRLTRRACESFPDLDEERTRDAVVELLVASEVYRAYIRPDERLSPLARKRLERARDEAVAARPELERELLRLADLAKAENPDDSSLDFAVRLQQTWGPVMAKGIEDTTFYRWHRLVALNEVGGDPAVLEHAEPGVMHRWAAYQQEAWPLGMTTLSTHDTKRSEDVRARLVAVAQDTVAWEDCSKLFREAADEAGVDRPTAHLLWQTLVGAGPLPKDRLHGYLTKAMREAKRHTAWVDGDPAYEERVLAFADEVSAPGPLRAAVDEAVLENQDGIRAAILGQKLLQLLLPGTADTYQGCEVVNLSLVDPDNRRPVDYDALEDRLTRLEEEAPISLDDEKLLVTSRALRVRRELRDCFGDSGDYEPLATGTEHALGFVRGGRVAAVVTRAPRRLVDGGGWKDETVTLPVGTWRDDLTGRIFDGGRNIPCADLFDRLPVALLVAR